MATQAQSRSTWIISPTWDIAYLIAAPLVIFPLASIAVRSYISPETLALWVVSFASIGHHLPGFMRAYGDRELFRRFRWRFILAPPLLIALACAAIWLGVSSLEVVVLFWATWHILMQTYGFMRIYDLKRGINDQLTARLDFAFCIAIFSCGILFSESRVYGIIEAVWRTGMPILGPEVLLGLRWITGIVTGCIAIAWIVVNLVRPINRSGNEATNNASGICWQKIALATTTAFFYWATGRLAENILVGVAMFEIYHAIQYYAIVWVYNRKLADRAGDDFGPLGFLFRKRWFFLLAYLAAIAAFGATRLATESTQTVPTQQLFLAMFTASAMLHFYYDGFIWKVSEKKTQANLNIDSTSSKPLLESDGLRHVSKWGLLLALLMALSALQWRSQSSDLDQRILAGLTAWTPNVPELRLRKSRAALQASDEATAIEEAKQALLLRPRSHQAHADLGSALHQRGDHLAAEISFQQAVALFPQHAQHRIDLARVLLALDRTKEAEAELNLAREISATNSPDLLLAEAELANKLGDPTRQRELLAQTLELNGDHPEANFQLGCLLASQGDHIAALPHYEVAASSAQANEFVDYQRGLSLFALGNYAAATVAFRQATEKQPDFVSAHSHLGLALLKQDDLAEAKAAFACVIELEPNNAEGHYNAGLVAYFQEDDDYARQCFQQAEKLGLPPTPEIKQALNLP